MSPCLAFFRHRGGRGPLPRSVVRPRSTWHHQATSCHTCGYSWKTDGETFGHNGGSYRVFLLCESSCVSSVGVAGQIGDHIRCTMNMFFLINECFNDLNNESFKITDLEGFLSSVGPLMIWLLLVSHEKFGAKWAGITLVTPMSPFMLWQKVNIFSELMWNGKFYFVLCTWSRMFFLANVFPQSEHK